MRYHSTHGRGKVKREHMKRLFAFGATLLVLAAPSANAAIYDLAAEFSTTQNPNDPWSYRDDAGSLLAASGNTGWGTGWGGVPGPTGGILQGHSSGGDWLPTDVVTHTPTGPGNVEVRWTAPMAGIIDIQGSVWDAYINPDRDVGWQLTLNGIAIAESDSVEGLTRSAATASFASHLISGQSLSGISVSQGDTVKLLLHTTTLDTYGHFAGFQEIITLTPTVVPEPSTYIAGALLLLPFGIQTIRRLRK